MSKFWLGLSVLEPTPFFSSQFNWYLIRGQQLKCDYISGILGHLGVHQESGKSQKHWREQKAEEWGLCQQREISQMGAHAKASSWGELEPHGIRRIDHIGRPAANLELQRSEESELTSPADQLGSDQRAWWNDFIEPKAPFRTRARAAQLVPMAHYRGFRWAIPRESILRPEWGGSFRDCLEDHIEIPQLNTINCQCYCPATCYIRGLAFPAPVNKEQNCSPLFTALKIGRKESGMWKFYIIFYEKCPEVKFNQGFSFKKKKTNKWAPSNWNNP